MGTRRHRERLDDTKTTATPRKRESSAHPTLLDCINDRQLFKPWFKDQNTWISWFAFIAALFSLPMTAKQLAIYRKCTGRNEPPSEPAKEGWLICGRRAGKSFVLALCAVFLACFHDYRQYLTPGERGTVFVIATDRKQARTILRYIRALLTRVKLLSQMVEREWQEGFDLNNSVTIEVATASFKSTRGFTLVAVLLDEVAFFATEDSSSPDEEILRALRPGLLTIPNSMILAASSPYAKKGVLFNAYREHYGKEHDPSLVWKAPTLVMNPNVPEEEIAKEYENDPVSAAAEYGAEFRSDVETFIAREAVEAVTSEERERPYLAGFKYHAFTDLAGGGSGKDSATLAIGHVENGISVLDVIREVKPSFSPRDVVDQFSALLKSYSITEVKGDRYAGEWPREQFLERGIKYDPAVNPKSIIYGEFLPLMMSRKCDLLDHPKLLNQLCGLERRTARSGKDSIDHAPNGHDDIANAVAGVLTSMGIRKYRYVADLSWVGGPSESSPAAQRLSGFLTSRGL
ncbi:hypothetical protein [Bradyrhizobium viridifuturi]|uniref:hypothetical protein n=1 Tax=Bradyrhizobium viridifuturi TaxID=1654716 RepID=UPI00067F191B|nr:hypothetical protein [Bradyrhizobium viridifuturi]